MNAKIFLSLALFACSAHSAEYYLSASAGQSNAKSQYSTDNNPEVYAAGVGVRQDKHGFGIEVSRADLGSIGSAYVAAHMKSTALVITRTWQMGTNDDGDIRLGLKVGAARVATTFSIMPLEPVVKTGLMYGVNMEVALDENWSLGIEVSSVDTGVGTTGRTGIVAGSLLFKF